MAVKEKFGLKAPIDLDQIQEPDLDDGISTRSGWYYIQVDGEKKLQLLVRPDNFQAIGYLERSGYRVGEKLVEGGAHFLLSTNMYTPVMKDSRLVSSTPQNSFIQSVEQLLRTF